MGGGGFGGGGFGGGGFGGGRASGGSKSSDVFARAEMRELMNPPEHFAIAMTGKTITITKDDGTAVQLTPNDKKIKDDVTKIERRTKWDGDKLVIEFSNISRNTVVETLSVDPQAHQLRISTQLGDAKDRGPVVHVYDLAE